MDRLLRQRGRSRSERGLRDALGLARELERAGRARQAERVLAARLERGYLEPELLEALARASGLPTSAPPRRPHVDLRPARRPARAARVEPTLVLAGGPALTVARGLARRCGAESRRYRAHGEELLQLTWRLTAPWSLAPGLQASELRIETLPLAADASKLRRRALRSASALVLLGGDHEAELEACQRILDELRRVHGRPARSFPCLARGELATLAQVTRLERGLTPSTLAWLLREVARGTTGYLRPRPKPGGIGPGR